MDFTFAAGNADMTLSFGSTGDAYDCENRTGITGDWSGPGIAQLGCLDLGPP